MVTRALSNQSYAYNIGTKRSGNKIIVIREKAKIFLPLCHFADIVSLTNRWSILSNYVRWFLEISSPQADIMHHRNEIHKNLCPTEITIHYVDARIYYCRFKVDIILRRGTRRFLLGVIYACKNRLTLAGEQIEYPSILIIESISCTIRHVFTCKQVKTPTGLTLIWPWFDEDALMSCEIMTIASR